MGNLIYYTEKFQSNVRLPVVVDFQFFSKSQKVFIFAVLSLPKKKFHQFST